jgi:inhibitor of KinA
MRRSDSPARPKAIIALGDAAILVDFSDTLDLAVNEGIQRLATALRARRIEWMRDIVPALGSLAIHLDPDRIDALDATPLVRELVDACLEDASKPLPGTAGRQRTIEVPVCYEPPFALDLADVCARVDLSPDEVIRRHAASDFRVLMVGFAPGHPYLGGLDPRLAVPRRATPRPKVPRGAVAVANAQCVVYPYEIPGGWSVVGRTPLRVFDAARDEPSLFMPSDKVRFVPIDRAQYDAIAAREQTT